MKKNLTITVLITALAVISFFLFKKINSENQRQEKEKRIEQAIKDSIPTSDVLKKEHYIDPLTGASHLRVQDIETEFLEHSLPRPTYIFVRDTLAPALKLAEAKINELTRIKAMLESQLKASEIKVEENGNIATIYRDRYFTAISNSKDSSLKVNYNAIIDVVEYNKRKNVFSEYDSYVDISSPDKNLKINNADRFVKKVKQKKDLLHVGVVGEVRFGLKDSSLNRASTAVEAKFNPDGRFSPFINYGYNFNISQPRPVNNFIGGGVKLNIFKF